MTTSERYQGISREYARDALTDDGYTADEADRLLDDARLYGGSHGVTVTVTYDGGYTLKNADGGTQ